MFGGSFESLLGFASVGAFRAVVLVLDPLMRILEVECRVLVEQGEPFGDSGCVLDPSRRSLETP